MSAFDNIYNAKEQTNTGGKTYARMMFNAGLEAAANAAHKELKSPAGLFVAQAIRALKDKE